MQKLSQVNLFGTRTLGAAEAVSVVGMAALWTSAFKRLVYPVAYAYYRTGNADAFAGQALYAVAFVVSGIAFFLARERIAGSIRAFSYFAMAMGMAGSLGIALLTFPDWAQIGPTTAIMASGVLAAIYVTSHFAFWLCHTRLRLPDTRSRTSTLLASVTLFAILYLLFELARAQSMAVSAACPLVSGIMALAAAHLAPNEPSPMLRPPTVGQAQVPAPHEGALGLKPEQEPEQAEQEATVQAAWAERNAGAPDGEQSGATGSLFDPAVERFAREFGLSEREAELAAYTYRNYRARRIANELFIAESTVYTHQKRIYRKVGVHSKHELIERIDSWKREQGLE